MESKTRYEHPDPTPIDIPFGFTYESLADTIGRMVRVETLKNQAKERYVESFEESQDFDDEEPDITSPHEMTDLQEEMPTEWLSEEPPEPPTEPLEAPVAPPIAELPKEPATP